MVRMIAVTVLLTSCFPGAAALSLVSSLPAPRYVRGEPVVVESRLAVPLEDPDLVLAGAAHWVFSDGLTCPGKMELERLVREAWQGVVVDERWRSQEMAEVGSILVPSGRSVVWWSLVRPADGLLEVGRWRCRVRLEQADQSFVSDWTEFEIVPPAGKAVEVLSRAQDLGLLDDVRWPGNKVLDLDTLVDTPYWIWGVYFRLEPLALYYASNSLSVSTELRHLLVDALDTRIRRLRCPAFPLWDRLLHLGVLRFSEHCWDSDCDMVAGAAYLVPLLQDDPDVVWNVALYHSLLQRAQNGASDPQRNWLGQLHNDLKPKWWEAGPADESGQRERLQQLATACRDAGAN